MSEITNQRDLNTAGYRWKVIGHEKPKDGEIVILGVRKENSNCIGLGVYSPGTDSEWRSVGWTHWIERDVIPIIEIRDHCRESWEKLTPHLVVGDVVVSALIDIGGENEVVSFDLYQAIWQQAIAAAKQHGLENV